MKSLIWFWVCASSLVTGVAQAADMPRGQISVTGKATSSAPERGPPGFSREKTLYWGRFDGGADGRIQYIMHNLRLLIVDQYAPENEFRTLYVIEGADSVIEQDDINRTQWVFTISIKSQSGVELETVEFKRSALCHYAPDPFRAELKSKNNFFDVITSATVVGIWRHSYTGGC